MQGIQGAGGQAVDEHVSNAPCCEILGALVGPLLLLVGTYVMLPHLGMPTAWLPIWWAAPYAVLAAALLLAWWFHSSRMAFSALLLAATLLVLRAQPQQAPVLVCLLVPIDLAALAWLTERGLLNVHGALRLLLLVCQVPILEAVLRGPHAPPSWCALALCGLSAVVLTARLLKAPSALEGASLGMLATVLLAVWAREAVAQTAWLLTGGLMGLASLIQLSYGMAFLDELTGLPARHALRQQMAGLSGHYTIAMVDVDHFKAFNDTYGHDVGDQCLRMVASRLARVSGGGRTYRYGGEEFTVLFPGKGVRDAWDFLEDLRREIEHHPMVLRGPDRPKKKPQEARPRSGPLARVTVTVSIGVAERGSRIRHADEVLKAADKALYKAKRGRNQVCK